MALQLQSKFWGTKPTNIPEYEKLGKSLMFKFQDPTSKSTYETGIQPGTFFQFNPQEDKYYTLQRGQADEDYSIKELGDWQATQKAGLLPGSTVSEFIKPYLNIQPNQQVAAQQAQAWLTPQEPAGGRIGSAGERLNVGGQPVSQPQANISALGDQISAVKSQLGGKQGFTPGYKGVYAGKEALALNANAVNHLFKQYHGRDANAQELAYWTGKNVGNLENTLAKTKIYPQGYAQQQAQALGQQYIPNQVAMGGFAGIQNVGGQLFGIPKTAPIPSAGTQMPVAGETPYLGAPAAPGGAVPPPVAPTPAGVQTGAGQLLPPVELQNKYMELLKPTAEETNLINQINAIKASLGLGQVDIEGQRIPMSFITGQAAGLERQATAKLQPLIDQLGVLQAKRSGDVQALQAQLGFETQAQERQHAVKLQELAKQEQLRKEQLEAQKIELREVDGNLLRIKPDGTTEILFKKPVEADKKNLSVHYEEDAGGNITQVIFDQNTGGTKTVSLGSIGKGFKAPTEKTGQEPPPRAEEIKLSEQAQAVLNGTIRLEDLTNSAKTKIAGELDRAGYKSLPKLSAGAQEDIATMNTLKDLINRVFEYNTDGQLEGIGSFGVGTLKKWGAQFGYGSEEGMNVRSLIGNITGTLAKLRGGTSFTATEKTLLEQYVPTINDRPKIAINKMTNLLSFIGDKEKRVREVAQERILPTISPAQSIQQNQFLTDIDLSGLNMKF